MARRRPGLLKRFRRMSGAGLMATAVIYGLWYYQERTYWEQMSWMGTPQAQTWYDWKTLNRTLRNDGFLTGWSDLRANPLWTVYRLDRVGHPAIGARPGHFSDDWRTLWPVSTDDYTGSGYDRGHQAPNYAIAAVHGRQAQLDTFQMSNISPQKPDLNRRVWQRLEEVIIDHFAARFGTIWVTTGPIFDDDIRRMSSLIEIPDAFYKIIVAPGDAGTPLRMIAFIVPQDVHGDEPLDRFLASVNEIEARTGFNFFSELPDDIADQLESGVDTRGWELESVARQPARF
ncbi:DNA/RNA non-specific endonuclease [Kushneria indalinina]|uniref:Endonuclease G n=1 Tax=Kushneria indalinina DSM 14324 TaxID=1122140 RepID=A0A3D9DXZ8_9GAMM|nr:DNA/RNA non-specific endonuclease [Kushneria indalinina]REC95662.1 endonuclease G [Kushneria indalinina DSM 14324]